MTPARNPERIQQMERVNVVQLPPQTALNFADKAFPLTTARATKARLQLDFRFVN